MPRSCLICSSRRLIPTDVVLVPGEGGPEHGGDTDRVLVHVRSDVLRTDGVLTGLQRHDARFDIEVAAELLPDHVHVTAEHEVGARARLAGRFPTLAPVPLQRECSEHDRLRRALGSGTGRLSRRVEQVGQHPYAALLDLGRPRVLGVVDEVPVQVLGDQPLRLRLHPGGDERRQVACRVPFQGKVLGHQSHRVDRRHAGLWEGAARHLLGGEAVSEQDCINVRVGRVRHVALLRGRKSVRGSGQRKSSDGSASSVAEARHAGNISIAPMRKHKAPSSVPATATRVLSTSSERGST